MYCDVVREDQAMAISNMHKKFDEFDHAVLSYASG